MVVEEHMVCVAFNRMYCATYWFNPNILLHEKHYNDYKGNESIIALVVSGSDYECLYVDVGTNGRNPDGHAWGRCSLKQALENPDNPLNIPPPRPLPGRTIPVPFVL